MMQFFNFVNEPTFHFFKWVTESDQVDVDTLVRQAFDGVEKTESHQMGFSVSESAREALGKLLMHHLDEWTSDFDFLVDEETIGSVTQTQESLFRPLLKWALDHIYFETVAEALLRRASKWAPDRERPEAI